MQNLVYLIYLIATISFLSPFFLLNRTENTNQIKILKYFLIVGFIGNSVMLVYPWFFENPSPIAHIYDITQYIILILLLNNIGSKQFFPIAFIPIVVFIYESIYLNGWFHYDELFYVISTVFIAVISLIKFYKNLNVNTEIKNFSNIILVTFFVCSVSSIILGIYEKELRRGDVITAFTLIFLNNFITIVQNLGINIALWKLKKT